MVPNRSPRPTAAAAGVVLTVLAVACTSALPGTAHGNGSTPQSPEPLKVLPNSLVRIDPDTGELRQVIALGTALDGSQITGVPGGDVWVWTVRRSSW